MRKGKIDHQVYVTLYRRNIHGAFHTKDLWDCFPYAIQMLMIEQMAEALLRRAA